MLYSRIGVQFSQVLIGIEEYKTYLFECGGDLVAAVAAACAAVAVAAAVVAADRVDS